MSRFTLLVIALLMRGVSLSASDKPEIDDPVAYARSLATNNRRAEALEFLKRHLEERPQDSDGRVLFGIVLSWEGDYDQARQELEKVLATNRTHGDALPALINVELWSDHPERAEELTREGLRDRPNSPTLLLARARALKNLNEQEAAVQVLDRLLAADPVNKEAEQMLSGLRDSSRRWEASFEHSYEWFSDHRSAWNEDQLSLKRLTTAGSLIGRFSHANRFSSGSNQAEIDFYPKFRPGTYAYLNVGYSPDATLYPRYRFATDLYQSLGHGWEASGGYRRLGFSSKVNIYAGSLAKYYGNWLFTGRIFLTPDSVGTTHSFNLSARRYSGEGISYWGLRCGHGSSPAEIRSLQDIAVLNSSSFYGELFQVLNGRWALNFRAGFSQENRIGTANLWHYLANGALYFRF